MNKLIASWLFAVLISWFLAGTAFADQFDNPGFDTWSNCAVGSSVTYTQTTADSGVQEHVAVKKTLKEKDKDHVTLEDVVDDGGRTQTSTEDIRAKLDKKPDLKPLPNEMIQFGDKKIDCKVAEMQVQEQGHDVKVRVWTSDTVPGGLVKMREINTGEGTVITNTLELKSFEKK